MVYASGGSFKGTVEATTFVGDIANVGIGSDVSISGGGVATRTITFTDSSSSALSKSVLLEALIYLASVLAPQQPPSLSTSTETRVIWAQLMYLPGIMGSG
jgi:hypothetical protein